MTNKEFSETFDVLLNSYNQNELFGTSNNPINLNEYEKSIFLTKAQEEIVLELYTGKNTEGDSFDKNEETKRLLSNLISGAIIKLKSHDKFGVDFKLPNDLWFIFYEEVELSGLKECQDSTHITVVPITYDEYHRIKNNPFRNSNERRVLRLDKSNNIIELISKYNITNYYCRYIKKLNPIVLEDMPDNLTVYGENKETSCELHEQLHDKILDRAIELTIKSKSIGSNKQ